MHTLLGVCVWFPLPIIVLCTILYGHLHNVKNISAVHDGKHVLYIALSDNLLVGSLAPWLPELEVCSKRLVQSRSGSASQVPGSRSS